MRVRGYGFSTPIPASARPGGSRFLPISSPVGFFLTKPSPFKADTGIPVGLAGIGYPLPSIVTTHTGRYKSHGATSLDLLEL